jgi:hypothetical protein
MSFLAKRKIFMQDFHNPKIFNTLLYLSIAARATESTLSPHTCVLKEMQALDLQTLNPGVEPKLNRNLRLCGNATAGFFFPSALTILMMGMPSEWSAQTGKSPTSR